MKNIKIIVLSDEIIWLTAKTYMKLDSNQQAMEDSEIACIQNTGVTFTETMLCLRWQNCIRKN